MNDPSLLTLVRGAPCDNALIELASAYFSPPALHAQLGSEAALLGEEVWNVALRTPLLDFLDRPSKQLRASLVRSSFALAGGEGHCPPILAHVIEALHAGSLIIDDIQDESAARRGRPALHREYGVPVALNAGNWLYFWAFSLLDRIELPAAVHVDVYRWMHRQLLHCHDGQGLDLTARVGQLEVARVAPLVLTSTRLKTGSLLKLASALGALAAGAGKEKTELLASFGERVGIALQMLDDVGGLLSEKLCHKGHEDLRLGRPTWPWAWLANELPRDRFEHLQRSSVEVSAGELHPETLARTLRHALHGSGRVRVRRFLHEAFADLRAEFGQSSALRQIETDLRTLERSYA